MTNRRLTYAWLTANIIGMSAYLLLASVLWVAPDEQGTPGGPGDAFVWLLTVVPVMLLFTLVNLVALYRVIKKYKQNKQLVPILLWVIVCSFWGNVLLFNQLKSMRFVDSQYTQPGAPGLARGGAPLSFTLCVLNMKTLEKGNRIKLRGGYDYDPEFLKKPPNINRTGEVIKFIPGQNKEEAAVVKLDLPITCKGITGEYLVLELRYVGQTWETDGPVHLELCNFVPDNEKWNDRKQEEWIESHASFDIL